MAISDSVQTLTAAFSFGILLQAAIGSIFIYSKGHGSTILHDGPRLVLVLFLLFAALWAQIDFVNLTLPTTSANVCQGTLIFSTIFDQLARVAIEQFLLWSIGHGMKLSAKRLILQGLLVIRLVAGAIWVGFSRPEFTPTCIPRSSPLPTSSFILALDILLIGLLVVRANSLGMFSDLRGKRSSTRQHQSRALILVIAGFTVWTGTSVARILGLPGTLLIVRTVLPANGLLVLVGLVTTFSNALLSPSEGEMTTPEAQSPFVASAIPSREIPRDHYGNGSPKSGNIYAKSGRLFVVNQAPGESPTYFQTNRKSDTRGFRKIEEETPRQHLGTEQEQISSKHGPGYRGSSGVFGSVVAAPMIGGNQVTLAPPIRPPPSRTTREAVPGFPVSCAQQKKSFFNWSKPPTKTPIRRLGISKPIMDETDGSDDRSSARIPTIDLATAAINERERREAITAKDRSLANKPMPPPPSFSPQEGLWKSISTTRKEMPILSRGALPTVPASAASSLLGADANASSTSTSLSPGREEVRRRSPRNATNFNRMFDEKPMQQTGLQRNATTGLPSNNKSQIAAMTQGHDVPKVQRVMYMNNINYEHPGMVKTIIRDAASYEYSQWPKMSDQSSISSYTTNLKPLNSMIHRPRPCREDSDKERALFPAEPSPHHKRNKSGSGAVLAELSSPQHKRSKSSSAISSRRSLFGSPVGSPTQLLPLHPMPKNASELKRLLPNNTKSMTIDEKIQFLFPAPPRSTLLAKRRSSVPSLPWIPSLFMSESPFTRSPTEEEHQSRGASKRTTIASFTIAADPNLRASFSKGDASGNEDHHILSFSPNIYQMNISDGTWIPSIVTKEEENRNGVPEGAKQPSIRDMRKSTLTEASSTSGSSQDDSATYWGSVHSKIPHIDIKKAKRNGRSTFMQRGNSNQQAEHSTSQSPHHFEYNDNEEFIPVILDTDKSKFSTSPASDSFKQSFFLDFNEALPGDRTPSPKIAPAWHHRVGDQLPTFSERESNPRSRKMPPTPLLLNRMGRHATIVVHAAESSPVESPEKAIEEIKAQLKRLEEPNRDTFGSILRHVDNTQIQIEDRLRLLEILEKEMGQQEDQWQQMQSNIDRNSISTVSTLRSPPLPPPKDTDFPRRASQRDSRRMSSVTSRHARVSSSITQISKGEDSTCTTSTQSSDTSRASVWQQRLAEAQLEYLENAPALLRKSLNFLSMSNIQLGSPTPPDSLDSGTDNGTEVESDSENKPTEASKMSQTGHGGMAALWQPTLPSPKGATGRLWNHPYETPGSRTSSPEPAARNIRPFQRLISQPLQISSSTLWSKPRSPNGRRSAFGLWCSESTRPPSIVVKRASHRPKRKARRLTCLPDIVESPLPVPHKRDTLGIFQFPWGETSDQPIYQPTFTPSYLSSSTINSKFAEVSHQVEPESSDYTSSFFDDYDDEEDGDDEANYEDSEDEFYETTLSDIANLLKSTDDPSRQSLMFSPRQIIEDYEDDTDFETGSEADETRGVAALAPTRLPIAPLAVNSKRPPRFENDNSGLEIIDISDHLSQPEPTIPHDLTFASFSSFSLVEKAVLWTPQSVEVDIRKSDLFSVSEVRPIVRRSESPPAAIKLKKEPRKVTTTLPSLSSQNLWSNGTSMTEEANWLSASPVEYSKLIVIPSQLLWTPVSKQPTELVTGLFSISIPKSDNRATYLQPAAIHTSRKFSVIQAPLSQLESSNLWNGTEEAPLEHDWISESSVRPATPSICSSNNSSGRTSPSSDVLSEDASDASSVNTASTKASSVWGSIGLTVRSAVPIWWDSRSKKPPSLAPVKDTKKTTKTPASPAATEEARLNSNIPMLRRQKSREALATVRKSRVFATRELWEAKPLSNSASVKKIVKTVIHDISVAPTQAPPRCQIHHSVISKADWDAALSEAIAAGTPQRKRVHLTITKEEWAATLIKSVKESKSKLQRINATPKIWQAALAEALTKGQPSFAVKPPFREVQLWSSSAKACSSSQQLLWSKDTIMNRALVSQPMPLSYSNTRRPSSAENIEITTVKSTELWQPAQTTIMERDWFARKPLSSQTWAPRTVPAISRINENTTMWSTPSSTLGNSPDLFVHVKAENARKSKLTRTAALQPLNSNSLFKISESSDELTHWLHSTSMCLVPLPIQQSMPKMLTRSFTWTEPSFSPITSDERSGLWTAPSETPNNHSTFSFNVETNLWNRKKILLHESENETAIIQSSLWRPSTSMPESPKNWLVKARVSKVQFRY